MHSSKESYFFLLRWPLQRRWPAPLAVWSTARARAKTEKRHSQTVREDKLHELARLGECTEPWPGSRFTPGWCEFDCTHCASPEHTMHPRRTRIALVSYYRRALYSHTSNAAQLHDQTCHYQLTLDSKVPSHSLFRPLTMFSNYWLLVEM